jgi:hypothetical protein
VVATDEEGDPLYEDVGPTPRFLAFHAVICMICPRCRQAKTLTTKIKPVGASLLAMASAKRVIPDVEVHRRNAAGRLLLQSSSPAPD